MHSSIDFYVQRINIAIDYIEDHLDSKITTTRLAEVSAFSEFHFHRIFKLVTGETVNQYVKRLKMDKSKRVLVLDSKSITDIAFDFGYSNSANFARDIKKYFNKSASDIRKTLPMARAMPEIKTEHLRFIGVENFSPIPVIYKRIMTGYNPMDVRKAFNELFEFIQREKLAFDDLRSIGIGYDDPDYTELNKCRYDACISMKNDHEIETEEFNSRIYEPGKCVVFQFDGKGEEFSRAWDYVFKFVLSIDNFRPGDKPHFEEYLPSQKYAEGIFTANLCLPIVSVK